MSNEKHTPAERVLELDAAVPKAPWFTGADVDTECGEPCRIDCNERRGLAMVGETGNRPEFQQQGHMIAKLIVDYRNLAPQLAREWLAQRDVIEAALALCQVMPCALDLSRPAGRGVSECLCFHCRAARAFDAAMTRLGERG